jgi:hypothetical protein
MLYLKETSDLVPVPPNLPSWQLQVATHYWLPWCDFCCRQLSQFCSHTTWEQGHDRFHSVAVLIISMLLATGIMAFLILTAGIRVPPSLFIKISQNCSSYVCVLGSKCTTFLGVLYTNSIKWKNNDAVCAHLYISSPYLLYRFSWKLLLQLIPDVIWKISFFRLSWSQITQSTLISKWGF